MIRRPACLALLALTISWASASDGWLPVTSDGAWSIRPATAAVQERENSGNTATAVVRRTWTRDGQAVTDLYVAAVPMGHCAARAGTVRLESLIGVLLEESRFRFGAHSVGAQLAQAVCRAADGRRR